MNNDLETLDDVLNSSEQTMIWPVDQIQTSDMRLNLSTLLSNEKAIQLDEEKEPSNKDNLQQPNERNENILVDIFHVQQRLFCHLSIKSPLYKDACYELSKCFWNYDEDDASAIELVLNTPGTYLNEKAIYCTTLEHLLKYHPQLVKKRIKRIVPQPDVLIQNLKQWFDKYGPNTVADLYGNKENIKKSFDAVIELVKDGFVSDNPNNAMYITLKQDRDGLNIYKSFRGTSQLESFHQSIQGYFKGFNTSPYYFDTIFLRKITEHNINIAQKFNGLSTYGTLDFSLLQKIQKITNELFGISFFNKWINLEQFEFDQSMINETGFFYKSNIQNKDQLLKLNSNYMDEYKVTPKLNKSQQFIAAEFNCGILPPMPVKTYHERELFNKLCKLDKNRHINLDKINIENILLQWNNINYIKPNNDNKLTIYPKTIEHLTSYFNDYKERNNAIKQSAQYSNMITYSAPATVSVLVQDDNNVNINTSLNKDFPVVVLSNIEHDEKEEDIVVEEILVEEEKKETVVVEEEKEQEVENIENNNVKKKSQIKKRCYMCNKIDCNGRIVCKNCLNHNINACFNPKCIKEAEEQKIERIKRCKNCFKATCAGKKHCRKCKDVSTDILKNHLHCRTRKCIEQRKDK